MKNETLNRIGFEIARLLARAGASEQQAPRVIIMVENQHSAFHIERQLCLELEPPTTLIGPVHLSHNLPRGIYYEATHCGVQFTIVDTEGFDKLTPYPRRSEWPLLTKKM